MIYLISLLAIIDSALASLLFAKLTLWKMHDDLEEWIEYHTGMDIYHCPDQRKEYKNYTKQVPNKFEKDPQYPAKQVLLLIRKDLQGSIYKTVYVKILWLFLMGKKFK